MEQHIKDLIDKLHIIVKYTSEFESAGVYIPELNWIIINSNLTEHDQFETLLHELGHACQHHDCVELYNSTLASHSKCEYEADRFMLEELVENYMSINNLDASQVNYVNFIVDNNLSTYYIPTLQKILCTKAKEQDLFRC